MLPRKIFLIGLPGSGKTTLGKQLAEELGYQFTDLDQEIISTEYKSIIEIFNTEGEDFFRKKERQCLITTINNRNSFVMATGGGAPCFFDNIELMNKSGLTVYLNTAPNIVRSRLENDITRPLMKHQTLEQLLKKRESWYQKANLTANNYTQLKRLILQS